MAIGVWVGADHELPLTHPTECIAAILDMVTRTDPALTPTSPPTAWRTSLALSTHVCWHRPSTSLLGCAASGRQVA